MPCFFNTNPWGGLRITLPSTICCRVVRLPLFCPVQAFTIMLVYVWARRNPYVRQVLSQLFLIKVKNIFILFCIHYSGWISSDCWHSMRPTCPGSCWLSLFSSATPYPWIFWVRLRYFTVNRTYLSGYGYHDLSWTIRIQTLLIFGWPMSSFVGRLGTKMWAKKFIFPSHKAESGSPERK